MRVKLSLSPENLGGVVSVFILPRLGKELKKKKHSAQESLITSLYLEVKKKIFKSCKVDQ